MKNEVIIGKMLGYIEKVLKYTQGMDYDTFVKQEVILEACIFNLSQLVNWRVRLTRKTGEDKDEYNY